MLDMIGGILLLVPFFGLLAPAAWKHDPDSFSVVMQREEAVAPPRNE
jgi:hypothetical protein